jgi:hypothetical protein
MSDNLNPTHAGHAVAISGAVIRERILKNSATVADWVLVRLERDANGSGIISELYADYESYCRHKKSLPLPRKVWLAAMKLAGFETQSGELAGLTLKKDSAPE